MRPNIIFLQDVKQCAMENVKLYEEATHNYKERLYNTRDTDS